jgi:hypothetical protein
LSRGKEIYYTPKEGADGSRNWNFSHIKKVLDVQTCGACCRGLGLICINGILYYTKQVLNE